MSGLGTVIAAQLARWGGAELALERSLFGTTDPDRIAAAVDGWCTDHLGAGIARYRFFDSSSGSVHGVVLTDGRDVVVKGHRASVRRGYLDVVAEVQRNLAARGLPAPVPLTRVEPSGAGHLVAETWRPQHRPPDPYAPDVRRELAAGLARFVALAADHRDRLAAVGHAMTIPPGALHPVPHSARFDFDATAAGAEWIDDLARSARAVGAHAGDGPTMVVAHTDWRIQNLSVRAGALDAIYDWDSVTVAGEVDALATAATTFGIDWERPSTRFPSGAESAAFVADYATARGRELDAAERALLPAAMVATMAYGARCEHADPGPGWTLQRDRLAALGPALLADGLDALTRGAG